MPHAAADDVLSFTGFFKAMPRAEGERRFIYMEAANETRDLQNETVLAKALAASSAYFLRYGNVDVDHITQIGPAMGMKDAPAYEVGRPVDVRVTEGTAPAVFVKAELYRGDTPMAEMANRVWDGMTKLQPPQRWYPSVGGAVSDRDPLNKSIIRAVRWTNIGLSKTPVNPGVPTASAVPLDVLAKSWGPGGLDLRKALEAGYGTDMATLSGGGALRTQSLDTGVQSYFDFRDRLAKDLLAQVVTANSAAMQAHAVGSMGLSEDRAARFVERFMRDLQSGLKKRATS